MPDDFNPAMIEAMASEIGSDEDWFDAAVRVLHALPISAAALNALWKGEAVVVPKVRTREMVTATPFIENSWDAMLAASPYVNKEPSNG